MAEEKEYYIPKAYEEFANSIESNLKSGLVHLADPKDYFKKNLKQFYQETDLLFVDCQDTLCALLQKPSTSHHLRRQLPEGSVLVNFNRLWDEILEESLKEKQLSINLKQYSLSKIHELKKAVENYYAKTSRPLIKEEEEWAIKALIKCLTPAETTQRIREDAFGRDGYSPTYFAILSRPMVDAIRKQTASSGNAPSIQEAKKRHPEPLNISSTQDSPQQEYFSGGSDNDELALQPVRIHVPERNFPDSTPPPKPSPSYCAAFFSLIKSPRSPQGQTARTKVGQLLIADAVIIASGGLLYGIAKSSSKSLVQSFDNFINTHSKGLELSAEIIPSVILLAALITLLWGLNAERKHMEKTWEIHDQNPQLATTSNH